MRRREPQGRRELAGSGEQDRVRGVETGSGVPSRHGHQGGWWGTP